MELLRVADRWGLGEGVFVSVSIYQWGGMGKQLVMGGSGRVWADINLGILLK